MKRLRRMANDNIDNIINTIMNDSDTKTILENYITEYCEDNIPELYSEDKYIVESDVLEAIDKKLRNEYDLSDFVEKFLDAIDSDEDADKLYNSQYGKEKFAEELFSKYNSLIEQIVNAALNDFKSSL